MRLVLAAERLIAERGVGVSLREVAAAAGQGNNSAVHYHFGGRDALIEAVVEYRLRGLEARRMALLTELEATDRGDDVDALVDVLVRPMVELVTEGEARYYARFLEVVRNHPAVAAAGRLDDADRSVTRLIVNRLARLLDPLPPAVRAERLRAMATAMFALLADYERAVESGSAAAPPDVVAMLVGLLTAPERAGAAR